MSDIEQVLQENQENQEKKKLDLVGALHEVSIILGDQDTNNEKLKEIKDAVEEDYGKEKAVNFMKLAKLQHKNSFKKTMRQAEALSELNAELFDGLDED